ncbi:MAG TPA: hypothetical protein VMV72_11715 [Verrucomicrobiae bacterium]|nr:hypothetical protein [Verrucomicrobiae bacterium]
MSDSVWWKRIARWDCWVVGLVCLSVALRWWLVFAGGQYWFPDERRFWWSGIVLYRLGQGQWKQALEPILDWNQHPGFTCLGCVPIAIHWAWAGLTGMSIGQIPFESTVRFSAAILSLASVVVILLIGVIVRRAGGNRTEALIAMALMAGSNSMFYYSRHTLPYDTSLALALGSFAVGMQKGGWKRLLFSGWLAGAAFFMYYRYWAVVSVVSATTILWNASSVKEIRYRTFWFALGPLTWLVIFTIGCAFVFGRSFVNGMVSFAATVSPEMHSEGWWATWAYLWDAEHGLLILWLAALAWILWSTVRRRPMPAYGSVWVAMLGALYGLLVLGSLGPSSLAVYGRAARQLVPFLCLIGAFAGARVWDGARTTWGRRTLQTGGLLLILQAAWNFRGPLQQWFPRDVRRLVAAEYGVFSEATTVDCPRLEDELAPSQAPTQPARYVLLNAQYLEKIHGAKTPPQGRIVLRFAHPMQFAPYQYDEFTARERALIRRTDISMRLVDTAGQPELANPQTIP